MSNTICVKMLDSSMMPTIKKGDIVVINKVKKPLDGDMGVYIINGTSFVKRHKEKNGKIFLLSDNGNSEIEIKKTDNFMIFGKVTGIIVE